MERKFSWVRKDSGCGGSTSPKLFFRLFLGGECPPGDENVVGDLDIDDDDDGAFVRGDDCVEEAEADEVEGCGGEATTGPAAASFDNLNKQFHKKQANKPELDIRLVSTCLSLSVFHIIVIVICG